MNHSYTRPEHKLNRVCGKNNEMSINILSECPAALVITYRNLGDEVFMKVYLKVIELDVLL